MQSLGNLRPIDFWYVELGEIFASDANRGRALFTRSNLAWIRSDSIPLQKRLMPELKSNQRKNFFRVTLRLLILL